MKFHIQKDFVTRISYFNSRPDPVSLGEVGEGRTGNLGKRLEFRDQDETWWEE